MKIIRAEDFLKLAEFAKKGENLREEYDHLMQGYIILSRNDDRKEMDLQRVKLHSKLDEMLDTLDEINALDRKVRG